MKKLFLIILIGCFALPLIASAGTYTLIDAAGDSRTVYYEGFVPCGKTKSIIDPSFDANGDYIEGSGTSEVFIFCQICHLFVMIQGIVNFILIVIVPPVATLVFIFGGIAMWQGGANPEKLKFARDVLVSALIGLAIIYGSWLIINLVLWSIGVAEWTGLQNWFEPICQVTL